MPQQLIYTSAPRGLVAGRAGFCTVAMSAGMREALALRLEQLSYLDHGASGNVSGRVVRAFRSFEIRGTRYLVLSRIQDCGLDFTQRSNFLAHHLVFAADELSDVSMPSEIFRHWRGWLEQWSQDPQVLENEQWANLYAIPRREPPARSWARLTGDAMNALGLLEISNSTLLNADGIEDDTLLDLFSEAAALMEIRERRSDWRSAAWQQTFTTQHQQQDVPTDFRWRCFAGELPATSVASSRVLPLLQVRPSRVSVEEASFARSGYQPPKIVTQPADARITEGETVMLRVEVTGIPMPTQFQWLACTRAGAEEPIPDGTAPELRLTPARGCNRYVARISNTRGDSLLSRVAEVSVEARISAPSVTGARRHSPKLSADAIESAQPWAADPNELQTFLDGVKRQKRRKIILGTSLVLAVAALAAFFATHREFLQFQKQKPLAVSDGQNSNAIPTTQSVTTAAGETNTASKFQEAEHREQLIAVFLGSNSTAMVNGKFAAHFNWLHEGPPNSLIRFTVADWPALDLAGVPPTTIAPQSNVVCSSGKSSVAFSRQKDGETISCNNLAMPHIIRFGPTNSAWRAFRVLIWPEHFKTNQLAHYRDGEFTIDNPLLPPLHPNEANGDLKLEFSHPVFGTVLVEYRPEYKMDVVYSQRMRPSYERKAKLEAQSNALRALNRLRSSVTQEYGNVKGADMWAEIDAVCTLAIEGTAKAPKFGFAGGTGAQLFPPSRQQAAANALKELAETKFKDAGMEALSQEAIQRLEEVGARSSIEAAVVDVGQQLLKAEDDLMLRAHDLSASIVVMGSSKRAIIDLSLK